MTAYEIRIDGNKVRFWALKKDAAAAAKVIGWRATDLVSVRTRFCGGFAIRDVLSPTGFLSRERFGELHEAAEAGRDAPVRSSA